MKEREIFDAALAIADPDERDTFLNRACNGDPGLQEHLRGLLEMERKLGRFLEAPDSPPTMDIEPLRHAEGPGTVIGPYKLREQIGEGGMGAVYVAEQTRPVRRKVALKIIKPGMDTRQVIARFEAERQALAMMDHPNIARVHDGGATESSRPYFVMELVRGIPITEYCDRERLSIPERLELFVQVCRAVQHAHQKGVIHRDLKPSNILVTVIDGAAVPKIIDFGVAKATGASLTDRTVYTAFHQFVGTPLYMSPEQADLSGMDVDTRSDIYALGVLLYELLTGTTPLDQATFRMAAFDEVRRIIREQEPPRPSTRLSSLGATRATVSAGRKADARQLDRTIRGELDWIVMKALEKDRRRRYETANDFAADVVRYLTDRPVEACPPSAWYRFAKYARRHRAALVTSALVATALVLGTAVSTWMAVRATRAEQAARRQRDAATAAREAEGRARGRAEEAEKTARAEADKAQAINEFLTRDLLMQAQPVKNPVSDRITLKEVVDRAADRVGARFGDRPLVEAALRCTLGETYYGLGTYERSRQQYAAAQALYERELGPDAPETANALVGLGMALRGLDYSKSERALRQAIDILRRARGVEHPDTLKAMLELVQVCGMPEAGELAAEVVKVSGRVLGREAPLTLHAMVYLAELLPVHGKLSDAEALASKALDISRRVQGETHPHTIWYASVLGRLYRGQGKLPEAERLYAWAVEMGGRVVGDEHFEVLWLRNVLVDIYADQGKLSEAESLLLEGLEIQRRVMGIAFLDRSVERLARIYEARGKLAQAEALMRESLAVGRRMQPGERRDSFVSGILADLGHFLLRQGRAAEAEPHLRECLAIREAAMPDHWLRYNAMSLLGGSLLGQARYAEAEPLLLSGYQGIRARERAIPARARIRSTEALERIVQLYEAWRRSEKAAEWRAKLSARFADLPADVFARP